MVHLLWNYSFQSSKDFPSNQGKNEIKSTYNHTNWIVNMVAEHAYDSLDKFNIIFSGCVCSRKTKMKYCWLIVPQKGSQRFKCKVNRPPTQPTFAFRTRGSPFPSCSLFSLRTGIRLLLYFLFSTPATIRWWWCSILPRSKTFLCFLWFRLLINIRFNCRY